MMGFEKKNDGLTSVMEIATFCACAVVCDCRCFALTWDSWGRDFEMMGSYVQQMQFDQIW